MALLTEEAPPPPPERPRLEPRQQPLPAVRSLESPQPTPAMLLPEVAAVTTPTAASIPTPPAATRALTVPMEPAAPATATTPLPAPPPPRLLRADQVRYLVTPPAEMPVLSRRAGESGVVWLRVRIDTQGRPARIALHRSSGFKRLDEQALAAMAQARFAPPLEDGVAVEAEVIAPIEYAAD